MAKVATSYRLSEEAVELIKRMSEDYGISQADVVEMSVRITRRMMERGADKGLETVNAGSGGYPSG